MYDIIVVGAGPAGLTAALYALRASKSVLVIEQSTFGGQVTFSPKIENYPGIPEMSGNEFADKLLDQVLSMGAEVEMEKVTGIVDEGSRKLVFADNKMFEASAVIIAVGVHHRQLGLPKENEFVGNGVSYCAVCDGAFFKDKTVGVVGGGNSALQESVLLSDLCEKVYVFQNLPYLTGEKKLVDILSNKDNVEFVLEATVAELKGDSELTGVVRSEEFLLTVFLLQSVLNLKIQPLQKLRHLIKTATLIRTKVAQQKPKVYLLQVTAVRKASVR